MNWFVIYTKSRQEKKVALELEKMGITVYCPMINQIRQWSDRKKKVEVPLISSYVFVQLKERDRETVFEVPGIVRYVYWLEKPAIVRDEEIAVMKTWLSTQTVERPPWPRLLTPAVLPPTLSPPFHPRSHPPLLPAPPGGGFSG